MPFLSALFAEGVVVSPTVARSRTAPFRMPRLAQRHRRCRACAAQSPPMRAGMPRWSPDGTQIAFTGQIGNRSRSRCSWFPRRVARRGARPTRPRTRPIRHGHQTVAVCYTSGGLPSSDLRIVDLSTRQVAVVPIQKPVVAALVAGWPPHRRDATRSPGIGLYSLLRDLDDSCRPDSQSLGGYVGS